MRMIKMITPPPGDHLRPQARQHQAPWVVPVFLFGDDAQIAFGPSQRHDRDAQGLGLGVDFVRE
jgi:hypothetical protein